MHKMLYSEDAFLSGGATFLRNVLCRYTRTWIRKLVIKWKQLSMALYLLNDMWINHTDYYYRVV